MELGFKISQMEVNTESIDGAMHHIVHIDTVFGLSGSFEKTVTVTG